MQTTGPLASGVKTGIGSTAVRLTTTSTPLNSGIYLQALSGNTVPVYIGGLGVTTATGFALAAGAISNLIPVQDAADIYLIAASGSNEVRFIGG